MLDIVTRQTEDRKQAWNWSLFEQITFNVVGSQSLVPPQIGSKTASPKKDLLEQNFSKWFI